jgi:hypothetical protein
MPTQTFEFDDFGDEFTATDPSDELPAWPVMSATFTFKFHPPEPDVGIDYEQLEVTETTFAIDGKDVKDQDAFVASVYQAIGEDIEEGEEFVADRVNAFLRVWEQKLYEYDGD